MIVKVLFLFVSLVFSHVNCDVYDDKVVLTVSSATKSQAWSHTNTTIASLGCDVTGKFAFIIHGWMGSVSSWSPILVQNLLAKRGGCVIVVDWGFFANDLDYGKVIYMHWPKMSKLVTTKLQQIVKEGVSPDKIYMYGHSLGARMVIDAGFNFGENQIGMIDACDPAGPGFYMYDVRMDGKKAGKNVQCIHTSIDAGTMTRRCHQNFIMGECGVTQLASKTLLYLCQQASICPHEGTTEADIAHGLCNDFYNNAFQVDFKASNIRKCLGVVDMATLPAGYKMGYDETRSPAVKGIIPVPTSIASPYNVR